MEDNLKILNVEYLRNSWSDISQIVNVGFDNQSKVEDNLQLMMTLKNKSGISEELLIKLDHTQILI